MSYCQNRSQNVTKVTNLLHTNMDNSKAKKITKYPRKTEGTITNQSLQRR